MDSRNTLSADLPAPRDDEPARLRDDILDELIDHLACAYNRELLRGSNATEARQRVLDRFGDPAAVARRLWLDAMGGKIMAQRALFVTCLVLAVASLALTGAVWLLSSRAQQESLRMLAQQNQQAQAVQQEMLKQLRDVSQAIQKTRSSEWSPVVFRMTEETPDGPPAVGVSIALQTGAWGEGQGAGRLPAVLSDGSGIADLGLVHPGNHGFRIFKAWDGGYLETYGRLTVKPGSQIDRRIVCPKTPLERVPLSARAAWPSDLQKKDLVVYAQFTLMPIQQDGMEWKVLDGPTPVSLAHLGYSDGFLNQPKVRAVLCGPGPSLEEVRQSELLPLWESPYVWSSGGFLDEFSASLPAGAFQEIREQEKQLKWERGVYQLDRLLVLRAQDSTKGKSHWRKYAIVVASNSQGQLNYRAVPPPEKERITFSEIQSSIQSIVVPPNLPLQKEFWSGEASRFVVRPGQINDWTIPLQDELIAAVRKAPERSK
jgi:hypothetical protein